MPRCAFMTTAMMKRAQPQLRDIISSGVMLTRDRLPGSLIS